MAEMCTIIRITMILIVMIILTIITTLCLKKMRHTIVTTISSNLSRKFFHG